MGFNPVERLQTLLGPSPKDPWPALIPQILLWCFRRFCIQKLTESEGMLCESLWEDQHQLVHMYCPQGLESTSIEWMTPENMGLMYSSSEDYNNYFVEFAKYFDDMIAAENYAVQDELSEFLDTQISDIIHAWLDNSPFSIFPSDISNEDSFTDEKFRILIDALMFHVKSSEPQPELKPEPVAEPEPVTKQELESEVKPEPEPEPEPERQPDPQSLLWYYLSLPSMVPQSHIPRPAANAMITPPPEPNSYITIPPPLQINTYVEIAPKPAPLTVARAVAYRRTIRHSRGSRVKTRRSHPTL